MGAFITREGDRVEGGIVRREGISSKGGGGYSRRERDRVEGRRIDSKKERLRTSKK